MRNSIPSILKKLASTSVAAGVAITFLGGVAHADTTVQQRAQAEMNRGKDYVSAWQVALHANGSSNSPEQIGRAKAAEEQLNRGKDYILAWAPTGSAFAPAPEQIAEARGATEQMTAGTDYIAAHEATPAAQAPAVQLSRSAGTTGGHPTTRAAK